MTTSTQQQAHQPTWPSRPPVAWRRLVVLSGGFAIALVAAAGGYGYHRDELYFVAIGGRPALGYPDQPPLIPLLAHAIDAASGHSLLWLRVPAAIAGALVVLVTGLIAREFGAGSGAQLLAAASMAVSADLAAVSHVTSTSAFDLLSWTLLSWLVVRALRQDGPAWLVVGAATGVALEIKTLPVFFLAALLAGVALAGPRRVLASHWLWAGAIVAAALWAPNLVWQATHGWPQLSLSSSIAAGRSGSSQPRWAFLPYQFLMVSPVLAPVWLTGLWRLFRDPALARWRAIGVAYPVLAVLFIATGGKPYYLGGIYPVLLAAGSAPTLVWLRRRRIRAVAFGAALALSGAVSAVLMLPVVPVTALHDTPIVGINYDAGETVGWPRFAATVTGPYEALPSDQRRHTVVLGANYGEAGAMLRFQPGIPSYSGQNAMADFGPPPTTTTSVVAVGYTAARLREWFRDVRQVGTIDNGLAVDNDEQGRAVWLATGPTQGWTALWAQIRHLN